MNYNILKTPLTSKKGVVITGLRARHTTRATSFCVSSREGSNAGPTQANFILPLAQISEPEQEHNI